MRLRRRVQQQQIVFTTGRRRGPAGDREPHTGRQRYPTAEGPPILSGSTVGSGKAKSRILPVLDARPPGMMLAVLQRDLLNVTQ